MQAMQTVRGNLAANPVFWPEKPDDRGVMLPARWSATVLESRRVRGADGEWRDDPRGPVAVAVNVYGSAAMTLARCDMHRGDPVVAIGEQVRVDSYMTREGEPAARFELTAAAVCFDTILLRRRAERAEDRSRPYAERETVPDAAGTEA